MDYLEHFIFQVKSTCDFVSEIEIAFPNNWAISDKDKFTIRVSTS